MPYHRIGLIRFKQLDRITQGSLSLRTKCRNNTGPGFNNQEGKEVPIMVLRGKRNKGSWGVSFYIAGFLSLLNFVNCSRD